jgi:sulfur relay (sulfurtransferase) DsrF/TusC family protein
MAKILSVVERAYHGTLEEQDDTALWFTHMIKNASGDVSVLLRGNATNYAVAGQDASGLRFGNVTLSVPPDLPADIGAMIEKGILVYAVREDLDQRGILPSRLVPGVSLISRDALAQLWDEHGQIWHW